jgi:cell division protein FtsL
MTGLVLITFLTGMLIAYYYSQVSISGYKINSLNRELASLRQETVSLSEEIDRLESLSRIEYVATTRLKMVKPDSKGVVVVRADLAGDKVGENPAGAVAGQDGPMGEKHTAIRQDSVKNKMVHAFAFLMGIKGS